MSKSARVLLVTVTTFLLVAIACLAFFLPRFTASKPDAPKATETVEPRLHLQDERFTVLTEDEETEFPKFRKSKPNGSLEVGYGTPPGFPSGVPVQKDAWLKNNYWQYEDSTRYLFSGGEDEFLAVLDQFAYAGWKMDEDEKLGDSLRIVHFSNDVRTAKVVFDTAQTADTDPYYALDISG